MMALQMVQQMYVIVMPVQIKDFVSFIKKIKDGYWREQGGLRRQRENILVLLMGMTG